jgi:hypothetical protein
VEDRSKLRIPEFAGSSTGVVARFAKAPSFLLIWPVIDVSPEVIGRPVEVDVTVAELL